MKQQVIDDVEDHSVLNRVSGDLQVVMYQSESVHSPYKDKRYIKLADKAIIRVSSSAYQPACSAGPPSGGCCSALGV